MERNTKILLGIGAAIVAYIILKPKKATNTPIPLKTYDTDLLSNEKNTNKVATQPLFICREGVEIKVKDMFGKGEHKACQSEFEDKVTKQVFTNISPITRNPNYDGYNSNKQTIIGDTTIPNDIPSSIDTTGLIYGAIPKDLDVLLVQNNAGIYIQGIYAAEKEVEYCIDDLALRSADGTRTCWQGYEKSKSSPALYTNEGYLMQTFITKIVGVYDNYQVASWNFNYDTNLWEKAAGENTIESNNNEQLNNEIKEIENIYFNR
jgi:hypothetical protein